MIYSELVNTVFLNDDPEKLSLDPKKNSTSFVATIWITNFIQLMIECESAQLNDF
jgi:hypothetical protein